MAEGKKSFVAYSDWKETFDNLPDEYAGKLIKHIFAYVNDENPETEDFIIKSVFSNIKNALKRDLDKWEKQLKQRSEAGKKSAELRATKFNDRSNSLNENERNSTDSVSVSVSDINNISIPKEKSLDNTAIYNIKNRLEFYNNYQGNKMHLAIVFRFFDLLIEKYPNSSTLKSAKLKKWLDEVRLSIESDGTTVQRLIAIIEFLKWQVKEVKGIDTFWITQVQSITSIRGKNKDGVFKIDNIASKMNEYSNRCPEFKNHIDKEIANFTNKFKLN